MRNLLPCIKQIPFNELKPSLHPELLLTGIYAISVTGTGGSSDGMFYIGSTRDELKGRMSNHRWCLRKNNHHSKRMQNTFNKYGEKYFCFHIVELFPENIKDIDKLELKTFALSREQYWIDFIGFKNLFNECPIATSPLSRDHTIEEIAKRGASIKKALATVESKQRLSGSRKKLWKDPNYRAKFTKVWKGIWAQEGYSEKRGKILREAFKNSPDGRARLSKSSRKHWANPEYRKRISEAVKERMSSPEVKKIYSERSKKYWGDEEHSANKVKSIMISTASKKHPVIFISPDQKIYVTDSVSTFCKEMALCQTGFCKLARGVVKKYKQWTGYTLDSWLQVPNEAIRYLYGEHSEIPDQITIKECVKNKLLKNIQLTLYLDL